jgi:hypothetical protein
MGKKLKTSADDRKCAFPGCKSILSIYNHEAYCRMHRERMAREAKAKIPYHHFVETK